MEGRSQDIRSRFRRPGQSPGVSFIARIFRYLPAPLAAVTVFEPE